MNTSIRRKLVSGSLLILMIFLTGCWPRTPPPEPSIPDNILASQGAFEEHIRVVWVGQAGIAYYEVHRSLYPHEGFEPIARTGSPIFEDVDAQLGTIHWYRVRACSETACSHLSQPVSGYRKTEATGAPEAPRGVAATHGAYTEKIRVNWLGPARATEYHVYRSEGGEEPFERIATTPYNFYDDVGSSPNFLVPCRSYAYRVEACGERGCSPLSEEAEGHRGTFVVDAPRGVSASDRTFPDRVRINWDPVPGAVEYQIFREATAFPLGSSSGEYYDDVHDPALNPLEAERHYAYWVRAQGAGDCGAGPLSARVEGRASALPGVPANLTTVARPGEVLTSWTPGGSVEAPSYYELFRSRSREGEYVLLGTVFHPAIEFLDDAVNPGIYWYKVRAVNAFGASPLTEPTPAQVP